MGGRLTSRSRVIRLSSMRTPKYSGAGYPPVPRPRSGSRKPAHSKPFFPAAATVKRFCQQDWLGVPENHQPIQDLQVSVGQRQGSRVSFSEVGFSLPIEVPRPGRGNGLGRSSQGPEVPDSVPRNSIRSYQKPMFSPSFLS